MKILLMILFTVCTAVLMYGCAAAVGSGILFSDVTYPHTYTSSANYQITPEKDFETVAIVDGQATAVNVLGLFSVGNFGYDAAVKDALSKARGADKLVDVIVDIRVFNVLLLFQQVTTTVRGRAIKMKTP